MVSTTTGNVVGYVNDRCDLLKNIYLCGINNNNSEHVNEHH